MLYEPWNRAKQLSSPVRGSIRLIFINSRYLHIDPKVSGQLLEQVIASALPCWARSWPRREVLACKEELNCYSVNRVGHLVWLR